LVDHVLLIEELRERVEQLGRRADAEPEPS
jgi:hypothetical protein